MKFRQNIDGYVYDRVTSGFPFYRLQKPTTEREMQLFDRRVILVGAEGIVILFHG